MTQSKNNVASLEFNGRADNRLPFSSKYYQTHVPEVPVQTKKALEKRLSQGKRFQQTIVHNAKTCVELQKII
jgi:hypothetical protein